MKDDNDFDDQIQSDHKTASSMYEVGYGKPPLDTRSTGSPDRSWISQNS
jgi:hypothetical protein